MTPIRTLYFTMVPIDADTNGGALSCRNHVRRLNQDAAVELLAAVLSNPDAEEQTSAFLRQVRANGHIIQVDANLGTRALRPSRGLRARGPFLHEYFAYRNPHVDEALSNVRRDFRPDVIVIDHLYSALFARSLLHGSEPTVLIRHNREAEYFRQLLAETPEAVPEETTWLSYHRLRHFERRVHKHSSAVVAIGRNDLPSARSCSKAYWIPPYLDAANPGWQYKPEPELLFVGSIGHFPNKLAMAWIATEFARHLHIHAPRAYVSVIGAREEDVPDSWRRENVRYLGAADRPTLVRKLMAANLFIAPIENDFGSKLKVLEAVAYGTPILANEAALSGVPYLSDSPRIELADPVKAAEIAAGLVRGREKLESLSRLIREASDRFARSQAGRWGSTLREVVASNARVS